MASRTTIRNRMNTGISKIDMNSLPEVPITEICEVIKTHGGLAVDEAGEEWNGWLMGENSHCNITVTHPDFKKEFYLILSWYRRESGMFETVAYIS